MVELVALQRHADENDGTAEAPARPEAPAKPETPAGEAVMALRELLREAYAQTMRRQSRGKDLRSVATSRLAATQANREAEHAPTTMLINGEPCDFIGFKTRIIELFRQGVPTVELRIPGEVALRIGNEYMEGSYDLDVFVEATFVRLLQEYLRLQKPRIRTRATLELGPGLKNSTGTKSIREYYIIEMRNVNYKPQIAPA